MRTELVGGPADGQIVETEDGVWYVAMNDDHPMFDSVPGPSSPVRLLRGPLVLYAMYRMIEPGKMLFDKYKKM